MTPIYSIRNTTDSGNPESVLRTRDVPALFLKRPEHRLAHDLPLEAIDEFLAELASFIQPVEVHFQWRPQTPDPNDEMVLEAEIDGRADAVVTYNVADFALVAKRSRISAQSPADLLKKVRTRARLRIH